MSMPLFEGSVFVWIIRLILLCGIFFFFKRADIFKMEASILVFVEILMIFLCLKRLGWNCWFIVFNVYHLDGDLVLWYGGLSCYLFGILCLLAGGVKFRFLMVMLLLSCLLYEWNSWEGMMCTLVAQLDERERLRLLRKWDRNNRSVFWLDPETLISWRQHDKFGWVLLILNNDNKVSCIYFCQNEIKVPSYAHWNHESKRWAESFIASCLRSE